MHSSRHLTSLAPSLLALAQSGVTMQPAPLSAVQRLDDSGWDGLLALATRHGLRPLMHAGATVSGLTAPEHVQRTLSQRAVGYHADISYGCAWNQLRETIAALNRNGIEPAILKGPLFALRYYRTPDLRPFIDLDLLITLDTRQRAEDALVRLGYSLYCQEGRTKDWYTTNDYHYVYSLDGGLPVELHWALNWPHSQVQFDLQDIWGRSRMIECLGGTARELAPEDHLVFLAVHAAKHQFRLPLRQYADLTVLVDACPEIDWDLAWQRASQVGAAVDMATLLVIASELGFLTLPVPVEQRAHAIWRSRSRRTALARYAVSWPYLDLPEAVVQTLAVSGWKARWGCIAATIHPRSTGKPVVTGTDAAGSQAGSQSACCGRTGLRNTWSKVQRLSDDWAVVQAAADLRRLFEDREDA